MGDRANICMVQNHSGKGTIYLYTHWKGSELPKILQQALQKGKERWNDESYLARIIFCAMVGDDMESLTGFGISTYFTDNEHPILVVDAQQKIVGLAKESDIPHDGTPPPVYQQWSFASYCDCDLSKLPWG